MQSCKLPIEVCERVIDNLALPAHNSTLGDYVQAMQSGNPTLYACSLVCWDWVPRSQHHLFRCVKLCTTREADAFLSTLARHPHKAQLVRFLGIVPLPPPSPLPKPVSPFLMPSDSPAPTSSSSIVHTLPSDSFASSAPPITPSQIHSRQVSLSVSNAQHSDAEKTSPQSESGDPVHPPIPDSSKSDISKDKIEGISIPPSYYNWIYKLLTRLPPLLVNLLFLALVNLPTLHPRFIRLVSCFKTVQAFLLENLTNQSFSEIIQVVNRLPRLKFIYFDDSKWDRPIRYFPSHRLRPEMLYCDADGEGEQADMLDWMGSLQDLSRLRLLRFHSLYSSNSNRLHHILQRCTHSLRFLNMNSTDVDMLESLSLSNHSKLESLGVLIYPSPFPNGIARFSSCISQLLSPSLAHINFGTFDTLDLESLAASQSIWKDIDNALSDPKFIRLKHFVISLSPDYEGNLDHHTLRVTLKTILPASYKRGILWVGKFTKEEQRAYHICDGDEHEFSMSQFRNSYFQL